MLHKNVLCQTDLTMAELEKIEQELETVTTKLQCSKQEQKLGMSAEKKLELLKSDESAKFNTDISSLMCFTFLFNTLLPYTDMNGTGTKTNLNNHTTTKKTSKRKSVEENVFLKLKKSFFLCC